MENCINEKETFGTTLNAIEGLCKLYANHEMDTEAFAKALSEISETLWRDKDASLVMVKTLADNDDLYELWQEQSEASPVMICAAIPKCFWEHKENVLCAIKLIVETLFRDFECATCYDIERIFENIPNELWKDRVFALSVVDIISKWGREIEDLGCIDEVIPDNVFDTPDKVDYTIISLAQASEFNAADLYLYPAKAWENSGSIFLMLGYLADALDGDSYNMYPTFRGGTKYYMERFLSYVPKKFKADKDFVLNFLGYDTLSDGFEALYAWMDQGFWADKEVVMKILDNDFTMFDCVSKELMEDEEFKQYLEENFDLD